MGTCAGYEVGNDTGPTLSRNDSTLVMTNPAKHSDLRNDLCSHIAATSRNKDDQSSVAGIHADSVIKKKKFIRPMYLSIFHKPERDLSDSTSVYLLGHTVNIDLAQRRRWAGRNRPSGFSKR